MRATRRRSIVLLTPTLIGLQLAITAGPSLAAGTGTITTYQIPAASVSPWSVVGGPDGNLWFVEKDGYKVGRITPTGQIVQYPIPTPGSQPEGITPGPDGNLWFTENLKNKIGRVTPAGTITEFPARTAPKWITTGADGDLWFTHLDLHENFVKIARMTTAGVLTDFKLPMTTSWVGGISHGPDGNVWFTDSINGQIGRITPAGSIKEFPLPVPSSDPLGIAPGPDGNMWFTEHDSNQIGRITPTGTIREFPVPTSSSDPEFITPGPDGNLWFTEFAADQIARVTPTGTIKEFPSGFQEAAFITAGPDGNLWFTGSNPSSAVSRFQLATAGSAYALVMDGAISPSVRTVDPGTTMRWTFEGPNTHSVTDSTTQLFDSGPRSFMSYTSFTFQGAGTYAYGSTVAGDNLSGFVAVRMTGASTGSVGSPLTVRWASSVPPGCSFTVRVKTPGASTWGPWKSGVTTSSGSYAPGAAGTYQFEARMRTPAGSSGYSPIKSVKVS